MSRSTPPTWPQSSPDCHAQPSNGSSLQVGILLGEMRNEGRRQTEILLAMLEEQRDLPDRLASRMTHPSHSGPQPTAPPTGLAAAPAPSNLPLHPATVSQWADLARALWPLALIGALVAGKISSPEFLPVMRHALGIQVPHTPAPHPPSLPAASPPHSGSTAPAAPASLGATPSDR